jgi:hypothetical protein
MQSPTIERRIRALIEENFRCTCEVGGPSETTESLESEEFFVRIVQLIAPPDAISSFEWSWEPACTTEIGHTPRVDFTDRSAPITTVRDAQWYACRSWPSDPAEWDAWALRLALTTRHHPAYLIKCKVTLRGGNTCEGTTSWYVYLGGGKGQALPPTIYGMPEISSRQVGNPPVTEWYISGMGELSRDGGRYEIYIPNTSEFYNKVRIHEERHLFQFTHWGHFEDLFTLSEFYRIYLASLTSTVSSLDVENQCRDFYSYAYDEALFRAGLYSCLMEDDAYSVSNAVAPNYLEVDDWCEYLAILREEQ